MIKLLSSYLLVLIVLVSCPGTNAQSVTKSFVINGSIKNISPVPKKLYLLETGPGLLKTEALTAEVKNGKYRFEGELAENELTQVFISDDPDAMEHRIVTKNCFDLIIDAGEINIVSDSNLSNYIVSGAGAVNHEQYKDKEKEILAKTKKILASDGFDEVNYNNLVKLSKPAAGKLVVMYQDYGAILYDYVKKRPGTKLSNYFTSTLLNYAYFESLKKDTLYQLLPEKVKFEIIGQVMLKSFAWRMKIGSVIRDYMLIDTANNKIQLSSTVPGGSKYTLLNFWASWCKPCREEYPGLVSIYKDYKDRGFNIVGITVDGVATKRAWKDAILKDKLPWPQLSDITGGWGSSLFQLDFRIFNLPKNFLLDSNGKIIAENLNVQTLKAKLNELFRQ